VAAKRQQLDNIPAGCSKANYLNAVSKGPDAPDLQNNTFFTDIFHYQDQDSIACDLSADSNNLCVYS
jgi:hypothetical protein